MNSITAFPLHWPNHRPRSKHPERSNFHRKIKSGENTWSRNERLTVADSRDRLYRELQAMSASGVVISSNLQLKIDGTPRSGQTEPPDRGVAVYFQLNKQPHCLSCDKWDRCADNLAAIAKHVEAMRGQLRWGVADVASMFAGFKALPGAIITPVAMSVEDAERIISNLAGASIQTSRLKTDPEEFRYAYREAASRFHPDANSGKHLPQWDELQQASQVLKNHHGI